MERLARDAVGAADDVVVLAQELLLARHERDNVGVCRTPSARGYVLLRTARAQPQAQRHVLLSLWSRGARRARARDLVDRLPILRRRRGVARHPPFQARECNGSAATARASRARSSLLIRKPRAPPSSAVRPPRTRPVFARRTWPRRPRHRRGGAHSHGRTPRHTRAEALRDAGGHFGGRAPRGAARSSPPGGRARPRSRRAFANAPSSRLVSWACCPRRSIELPPLRARPR